MLLGDCVTVTEETLDRYYFIVTNKHTGESGKVPKEFISVGEREREREREREKVIERTSSLVV